MKPKFRSILCIDLDKNLPDLSSRISMFCDQALIFVSSLDLKNINYQQIDAILVSIYQELSEDFLRKFPNLIYIGILGSSTKKIDLDYCRSQKIQVLPVHAYCDHETAEWVLLQILKFYRDRPEPESVYGKTLGIVGAGFVGQLLTIKALALGLNVSYNAPTPREELEKLGANYLLKSDLFKNSQILTFHTPAHHRWLSSYILDQSQENALLINTCLGKISENQDLELFLQNRLDINIIMDSIAAASYPDLHQRALITQKPAFATLDSRRRLFDIFVKNIANFTASS